MANPPKTGEQAQAASGSDPITTTAPPADSTPDTSDPTAPDEAATPEAATPEDAPDEAATPEEAAESEGEARRLPTSFDELDLPDAVRQAVAAMGWETPTDVQAETFPIVTAGRDVLVQSQTGSGKTGAFCLPWLAQRFEPGDPATTGVQLLVLTPTRELAKQVCEQLEQMARDTKVVTLPVYGGTAMQPQLAALRQGVHAVVGTPGRILDHIRRRSLRLDRIRMAVLDEADEMLSMGFLEDIHAILDACPDERQTCLFSATVPPDIERIARRYMHDPVSVLLSGDQVAAAEIKHVYYQVAGALKVRDLLDMIAIEEPPNALIFCNTREETYVVASALQREGYHAEPLSSDLTQAARERVMGRMRSGQLRFLVATDVASRGIDISHIGHVINYSFPENAESYVHRTGRTGRAGRPGVAISLISPQELGNHYYLKLQYPSIAFEERSLPPAEELSQQRLENKLDQVSRMFPELVAPEWTLLTRHLVSDPRGEQVIAYLLKEAVTAKTERARQRDDDIEFRVPRGGDGDRRGRGRGRRDRGDSGDRWGDREDDRDRRRGRGRFERDADEGAASEARGDDEAADDGRRRRRRRDRRDRDGRGDDRERDARDERRRSRGRGRDEDERSGAVPVEASADQASADQASADQASADQRAADQASADQRAADQSAADQRAADQSDETAATSPTQAAIEAEAREAKTDQGETLQAPDDAATADTEGTVQARSEGSPDDEEADATPTEPRRKRRRRRRRRGGSSEAADDREGASSADDAGANDEDASPSPSQAAGETVAPRPAPGIAERHSGETIVAEEGSDADEDEPGAEAGQTVEASPDSEVTDPGTLTGVTGRRRRRRRRRRGKGRGGDERETGTSDDDERQAKSEDGRSAGRSSNGSAASTEDDGKRRRRRRRGGRRRGGSSGAASPEEAAEATLPHVPQDEIIIDIDESELDVVRDQFGEIDELDELTLKGRRRRVMDALQEEVELEDLSEADEEADEDTGTDEAAAEDDETDTTEDASASEDEAASEDADTTEAASEDEDAREARKRKRRRRRRRKKAPPPAPPELTAPPHKDFWEVWAAKFTYQDFEDAVYMGGVAAVPEEPEPPPSAPPPDASEGEDETEFVRVRLNVGRKHGKKAAHIRELLAESFGLARKAVRDLTVGEASSRFRLGAAALEKLESMIEGFDFDGIALTVTRLEPKGSANDAGNEPSAQTEAAEPSAQTEAAEPSTQTEAAKPSTQTEAAEPSAAATEADGGPDEGRSASDGDPSPEAVPPPPEEPPAEERVADEAGRPGRSVTT